MCHHVISLIWLDNRLLLLTLAVQASVRLALEVIIIFLASSIRISTLKFILHSQNPQCFGGVHIPVNACKFYYQGFTFVRHLHYTT
ncbi:hypothetical protein CS542_06780 [Pedobacter sp. IW39]|nr:hypothetical protein CS542_06780 [Pedobacter sp. IW39]